MDKELDQRLRYLMSQVGHPALRVIDGVILDRLRHERAGRVHALRRDVLSFAGALAFGLVSTMTFGPTSTSRPSALAGFSPLAPSALLERSR